jgi:hypothetical protein
VVAHENTEDSRRELAPQVAIQGNITSWAHRADFTHFGRWCLKVADILSVLHPISADVTCREGLLPQ